MIEEGDGRVDGKKLEPGSSRGPDWARKSWQLKKSVICRGRDGSWVRVLCRKTQKKRRRHSALPEEPRAWHTVARQSEEEEGCMSDGSLGANRCESRAILIIPSPR